MNKWIWPIIVVIVLGIIVYFGRNQVTSLTGTTPSPVVQTPTTAPTVAVSPTMSSAGEILMTKTDAAKGDYQTDSNGMTLYIFDKDTAGVSNCYDACATAWPPYGPSGASSTNLPTGVTVITRKDGSMQYAYNNMPLYYYQKDTKPGDTIGDGVNGVWHLVTP